MREMLDAWIYDSGMRIVGIFVGVGLALMGAVWVLQGLNSQVVPQSFMTGSRTWIVIGVSALVGGLALARWSWSHR
jgi:hypothetical protein